MIEFKHYTTMASNFSVLTRPLCLWLASLRSARPDTVGLSTQRSSQPLLCNVLIQSWKLSMAPSWLVIYHYKEKDANKVKKNIPWNSTFFEVFCIENYHHFLDIFPKTNTFFNNKMSVTEKSFTKNHKFHGTCITILIHYYKKEIDDVVIISKIFLAFSSFLCKEFEFFFASSQRMKSARIWPV